MATAADVLAGRALWAVDCGDALAWARSLPPDSVHCVATSPPYWGLRDYGVEGQLGLEPTVGEYVEKLVALFRELRRALHPSGVLWLNLGDTYATGAGSARRPGGTRSGKHTAAIEAAAVPRSQPNRMRQPGLKPKDRVMVPARVALALQDDGWWLRDEVVWHKPAPMTLSVTDRTTPAHEMVYLLAKRRRYFFDPEAIKEPSASACPPMPRAGGWAKGGRHDAVSHNRPGRLSGSEPTGEAVPATRRKRSVWRVATRPYKGAHFAVFPPELVEPMVLAGTGAAGVCPACGEPWRRLTKRTRRPTRPGKDTKCLEKSDGDVRTAGTLGWNRPQVIGNRDPMRHCTLTETVGWEPGCGCGAGEPVPAVVLDPFAGSGTTLMVAARFGRRAVGCELNPDYLPLVRGRMATVTPNLPGAA